MIKKICIFSSLLFLILCTESNLSKTIEIELIKENTYLKKTYTPSKSILRFLSDKDIEIKYGHSENKDFYTIELSLGTPSQLFSVKLDTTTSASWVPSASLLNFNITNGYNASSSSSVIETNRTIQIEDKDGDVEGGVKYDLVSIGDQVAENFGFVVVNEFDKDFSDSFNGKLGLGFRNQYGTKFSLLEALKNNGRITKKIFSLSNIDSSKGKLHLGDLPNYYTSDYSFCNLTSTDDLDDYYRDSWVCEISHVILGKAVNFTNADEIVGRAIFDSAYSYISVPMTYLKYFKNNYFGNNFNCNDTKNENEISIICNTTALPDREINFVLGGYAYAIDSTKLFKPTKNENEFEFMIKFNKENDNVWVLGQTFLNNYVIVFNAEDNHVGFSGEGKKINFLEDWADWYNGISKIQKANQVFYLIVGASILGSLLFILLLFIIVHSMKRRRMDKHGPLINERN